MAKEQEVESVDLHVHGDFPDSMDYLCMQFLINADWEQTNVRLFCLRTLSYVLIHSESKPGSPLERFGAHIMIICVSSIAIQSLTTRFSFFFPG